MPDEPVVRRPTEGELVDHLVECEEECRSLRRERDEARKEARHHGLALERAEEELDAAIRERNEARAAQEMREGPDPHTRCTHCCPYRESDN